MEFQRQLMFIYFVNYLFDEYVAGGKPRERQNKFEIWNGKALRVIPRGKQRLTVYRAHQVQIYIEASAKWPVEPF